jgi:adenosylcobinamide kinase / adenosylcobinamide-phosphate guanylyltransferase
MSLTLVLGGARSGKSRHAESLSTAKAYAARHYIATAQAFDAEMTARIAQHKVQRGNGWITHEEPLQLADALSAADGPNHFILVDCLTLWLSNLMLAEQDWQKPLDNLLAACVTLQADVVCVSNEVGLGLVPDTPLGRRFRDAQGIANQSLARHANHVVFIAAGLPLTLK